MTAKGYIKTIAADAFRTQGRGGRGVAGAKLKDEDYVTHIIHTSAHAYLLFFSNLGPGLPPEGARDPDEGAHGAGHRDRQPAAAAAGRDDPGRSSTPATTRPTASCSSPPSKGQVKKTKFTEYDSSLRAGLIAINLRDGDELVQVIPTNGERRHLHGQPPGHDHPLHRGRGALDGPRRRRRAGHEDASPSDEVVSCDVARDDVAILIVTDAGYGKRTQLDQFNRQGRGGQGVRGISSPPSKGVVVAAFMVGLDDEIFVIASGGVVIRMPVRDISSQGRDATGVRVMNLDDDARSVAAVAPVLAGRGRGRRRRSTRSPRPRSPPRDRSASPAPDDLRPDVRRPAGVAGRRGDDGRSRDAARSSRSVASGRPGAAAGRGRWWSPWRCVRWSAASAAS